LRPSDAGECRERDSARCQMQKFSAEKFYDNTSQRHQSYPNCRASERVLNVGYWHKADNPTAIVFVRYWTKPDHSN
jgi:hypothetical protein